MLFNFKFYNIWNIYFSNYYVSSEENVNYYIQYLQNVNY